jgi:hypothetical protein
VWGEEIERVFRVDLGQLVRCDSGVNSVGRGTSTDVDVGETIVYREVLDMGRSHMRLKGTGGRAFLSRPSFPRSIHHEQTK